MPCLTSAPAQAALFLAVSGALLLGGYQTGRHVASGKRVAPNKKLLQSGALSSNASDFDPSKLSEDVLKRLVTARSAVTARPVTALAAEGGLEAQRQAAAELHGAVLGALGALASSFTAERHPKLLRALELLGSADTSVQSAWQALLPEATERLRQGGPGGSPSPDRTGAQGSLLLSVTVSEKPFGMHVKQGTSIVEEVFPGFQAQKAGIRRGCDLKEVAGQKVEPGTWLEIFQKSPIPFAMKLSCSTSSSGSMGGFGHNLLSQDQHRYRVMVTKKPYGMNIQANKLPRVVEVLPGFPAEAAGVQRGFVLTEVNEVPVDAVNWFEEYQMAQLPFTLTFDTNVPVRADNPYFKAEETPAPGAASPATERPTEEPPPGEGYRDFRCNVETLPFGMQVKVLPHRRPRVVSVVPKSPAFRAGVLPGDVLMEVAGRPVSSKSWFSSLQQARPPFGLLFRRPNNATVPP